MRRAFLFCCVLLSSVVFSGCEDDPILEPGDPKDDGGGSYGIINLDTAQSDLPDPGDIAANPETF